MIRPLPFQWPEALLFWAIYLWAFTPEIALIRASRSLVKNPEDAGTMRLIVIGNQIALFAAFFLAFLPYGRISATRVAFYAGTALLAGGSLVRRHCFKMLGTSFTGAVTVREGQPIVERGLYRWVRHPSYTAGVAMFCGLALALGSWLSFVVTAIVPPLLYRKRVRAEETALLDRLGEPYRAYMERTRRYIPFVL